MRTDDQRTEDLLREALSAIARSVSPPATAWAGIERAMERRPERRRQGYVSRASLVLLSVLLSLGLCAASIAGLWAVFRGAGRDQPRGAGQQNLEPEITARVVVDESITGLAAAPSSLWVTAVGRPEESIAPCEAKIYSIDPNRNAVTTGIPVNFCASDVVWGFGSVWLGGYRVMPPDAARDTVDVDGIVARLDPESGKLVAEARIGPGELVDLAVGAGSVWAARNPDAVSGEIVRLDPSTMEIMARLRLDAPALGHADLPIDALAASGDAVFISAGRHPTVLRLEPSTMKISTLVEGTWAFAVAGQELWAPIPDPPGTTKVAAQRFDAETGAPLGAPIELGDTTFFPFAIAEDGVWFVGGRRNVVVARLNTSLLMVDEEIPVSSSHAIGAVFDQARGVIWIAERGPGTVLRIDLHPTA